MPDRRLVACKAERQQSGAETFEVRQRFIETILLDERSFTDIPLSTHVPLAEMPSRISVLLQQAGERGRFRIQPLSHPPLLVGCSVIQERSDLPSLRILPRRQRGARWR